MQERADRAHVQSFALDSPASALLYLANLDQVVHARLLRMYVHVRV